MSKLFAKILTSILLTNLLLFLLTIILHEFGHYLVGKFHNCKDLKIVFWDENLGTYTEMKCLNYKKGLFELSGFLLTIPFSLIFLFLEEKHYFYLINGLNLTFSFSDLYFLNLSYLTLAIGFALIIFSEIKTVNFIFNSLSLNKLIST